MHSKEVPPLSIGVSVGGTGVEARRWGEAAMKLARRVSAVRDGIDSPLSVNVVYHVPGEVVPVDFSGIRTGTFLKEENLLMVQVALPAECPSDPETVLCEQLFRAVAVAEEFAQRQRLVGEEGLQGLRSILQFV